MCRQKPDIFKATRHMMELIGLTQTTHLWVFFAMVAGIIILPGMDIAYVMASALDDVREGPVQPWMATFGKAAATCLLNPKAYVFMLAVFPQFLRLEYGPIATQAVLLSAITALTQVTVYGAIAMGAAHIRVWLRTNQQGQVRLGQGVGVAIDIGRSLCFGRCLIAHGEVSWLS
jgi:threonine/homoserine/homoserine lactone efflux protein